MIRNKNRTKFTNRSLISNDSNRSLIYSILTPLEAVFIEKIYPNINLDIEYKLQLYKFNKLNDDVMTYLRSILDFIKQENYLEFKEDTQQKILIELGQKLINTTYFEYGFSNNFNYEPIIFENYRTIVFDYLDAIIPVADIYDREKQCYKKVTELESILYNKDKLHKFIEEHYNKKHTNTLLSVNLSVDLGLELAPEYVIYIERYGFPENGIFNLEELSQIIAELNNHCV